MQATLIEPLLLLLLQTRFGCGAVGGKARFVVGVWAGGDFVGYADFITSDLGDG
jgi:hypothetical protein